jgi:Cu/Ag efflux protein CusF
MTMGFTVDAPAVSGLRKGDRVLFAFDKTANGYAIRSISKQGGAS